MQVIKRDGRIVDFNIDKIKNAVLKAFNDVNGTVSITSEEIALSIAKRVEDVCKGSDKTYHVEEIQDFVEELLMEYSKSVAKSYILYRNDRNRAREKNSALIKTVKEKLSAKNVQNQNANVDEKSFGGRIGEATSAIMKQLALNEFLAPTTRDNHINNRSYTHDLDHYPVGDHNCLSIPFDHLLRDGFNTRQTDVRGAKSVGTACQLIAVLKQLQSLQQFGGVSATHIDWTLVPYVRMSFTKHLRDGMKYCENKSEYKLNRFNKWLEKDLHKDGVVHFDDLDVKELHPEAWEYAMDMTTKETYQAVEGLYHNLNTLQSRSGNQLPFTSINYGTCTLPEGRLFTKALLDVSIKGIGKIYKTSIFPCGIFQYMKGVNAKPGDPNYDLYQSALYSTATRLYPNYANVDWSGNAGYDRNDPRTYFSTMGCRTANGWDINGLGQLKDGRGNIAPATIIMPTLAMEAKEASESNGTDIVEEFMIILDNVIHETKDGLIDRFEWICSQSPDSAKFMYENNLMAGYIPEEGIRSALKHGTLAIGQLGLAETLQILIGCDHTDERGMELAKRIEQLFKDRCAEFKEEYKLNFGVYYTPAENLCYTAMTKFKEKYGVIPNVSDRDFFTNSIHVPVWKEISPFDKIDIESQLTGYSSAGCITYVELDGGVRHNIKALETIVNYAMEKDIPYFAINVPNDTCLECGFTGEFNGCCPVCGNDHIQQLRRVTGYLTGDYKTAFNKGKQQESEMRVKHR